MKDNNDRINESAIGAVILGAGQSQRMGQPKLILPWGDKTVIEQIVCTLQNSGINNISVVTGAAKKSIEKVLTDYRVQIVFNPYYLNNNMITSLQIGIISLLPTIETVLVVLGDQPGIEENVVRKLTERYQETHSKLIVPSYQNHRGHPWLVHFGLWDELLNIPPEKTMHDFLNLHSDLINYVKIETPSILRDIDTLQDYLAEKPSTLKRSE